MIQNIEISSKYINKFKKPYIINNTIDKDFYVTLVQYNHNSILLLGITKLIKRIANVTKCG
jgi:hypothetical protein